MTDRPLVRAALRLFAFAATSAAVLGSTQIASASAREDGAQPGTPISLVEALLWLAGVPMLLFVLIVLLVSAPSMAKGPRYRPGVGWWAAPVWFNGPQDADSAVRSATATVDGGGASARW